MEESKTKETKSEGSDHKMEEGSKIKKEMTNVKGKMLINGKAPGANAIVFLETKTKMKVPSQKILKISKCTYRSDYWFTNVPSFSCK